MRAGQPMTTDEMNALRLRCAERIAALTDALRSIPAALAPVRRASTGAVGEQIFYGYETHVGRAQAKRLLHGKYELDGWWSEAAAELVRSGRAAPRQRLLARDHVEPIGQIAADLLAKPHSPAQIVELLEAR